MRLSTKFAALTLLTATTAFASGGSYKWEGKKLEYHHFPDERCILKLVRAFQPGGEHQPVHVEVKNATHRRLAYTLAMTVDGADAGTISVDNVNAGDLSERDANKRFYGNVAGSTLRVTVTSCTVRPD